MNAVAKLRDVKKALMTDFAGKCDDSGLTLEVAIRELNYVMVQNENLGAKLKGIEIYFANSGYGKMASIIEHGIKDHTSRRNAQRFASKGDNNPIKDFNKEAESAYVKRKKALEGDIPDAEIVVEDDGIALDVNGRRIYD